MAGVDRREGSEEIRIILVHSNAFTEARPQQNITFKTPDRLGKTQQLKRGRGDSQVWAFE